MEIVLDTTVQIDRIFKRDRKEKISAMISAHHCVSSTYVLGEYNNNIVKNFVALYNIMQMEKNLSGVRDKINDTVFHRDYQRIRYVLDDLCKMYHDDYELIKEELFIYSKTLIKRFMYGISSELLNETSCHRAQAEIRIEKGAAVLDGVECSLKDDFCQICSFWQKHIEEANKLSVASSVSSRMKTVLNEILDCEKLPKGNRCRTLGDCIIALETSSLSGRQICTTNIRDFKPICDCIGIGLYEI